MPVLAHRPRFKAADAARLAAELYGLRSTATGLPSERDQNFLLTIAGGDRFVLKIANAGEDRALLEAQHAALELLARATDLCPRVVLTLDGRSVAVTSSPEGVHYWVRLATYVPGVPMACLRRRSPELLFDLGRQLGRVDRVLSRFDHPAVHRDLYWDLANAGRVIAERSPLVANPGLRALVQQVTARALTRLRTLSVGLRRGTVHHDANDHNVLVLVADDEMRAQRVTGLIDFGDMVHGFVVAEPAVAAAYAALGASDPLEAIAAVTSGFHSEYPLEDAELAVLFDLACLRLCMSVSIAADQMAQAPDDEYLAVSQAPILRTLPRLAAIPARFAEARIRSACSLPVFPAGAPIIDWLGARTDTFAPVLGIDVRREPSAVVALDVGSTLLSGDPAQVAEPTLTARITEALARTGARVGIGCYDDVRLLYHTPAFEVAGARGEHRTVHLGIDLFAPAGTAVHAPLAGTVEVLADNAAPQDYGPVVILRHQAEGRGVFFTLYGHLSRESLAGLARGQVIAAGQPFASIGTPTENGGWTPHLHFQLLVDLLGLGCDVPGVGRWAERETWHALSPDPNLVLGIPLDRFPAPKASKADALAVRRERMGGNLRLSYREPLRIVRGWMQYLWDDEGRRFLDAYNNVPHVGHSHPRIVEAAHEQMRLLNTNTRYLSDLLTRYAERLSATLPAPLRVCYFLNSASEANELALRLARARTAARDVIVLESAYHGHTTGLIDVSPYKHNGPGGGGPPTWVHVAPIPDDYRGPYRRDDPRAGRRYAEHVRRIVETLQQHDTGVSAFLAETCPSVGGQLFLPEGYLHDVYETVRSGGGVCIADEVQTGLGRLGTHFWAFQAHGVVPDIVVMGKSLGNGHPLAAVVTTQEIASAFDNGMEFFSTYGGNPVSCAVGVAVLDVIDEEGLQAHARRVGDRLLAGLRQMADRFPIVGDVRGSGLFIGVELVRDRASREPAGNEATFVVNRMRELGVLLGTDGPHQNVIKIRPPMPFDERDADTLVELFDQVLAADFDATSSADH